MACKRHRDALSDVAAGEVPSPAVEAHLASCEACRGELAVLRRALAIADGELARLLSAGPSPELPARIRVAVSESTPVGHGWRPGFALVLAGAAAALLIAVVLVWQRHAPQPAATVETRPDSAEGRSQVTPAPGLARDQSATAAPAALRTIPAPSAAADVRPGRSRSAVSEPEVLVPPGELDALLRYATNLRRRTVTPDALIMADHSSALPEPKYAAIQPLDIVPLDPEETAGIE